MKMQYERIWQCQNTETKITDGQFICGALKRTVVILRIFCCLLFSRLFLVTSIYHSVELERISFTEKQKPFSRINITGCTTAYSDIYAALACTWP